MSTERSGTPGRGTNLAREGLWLALGQLGSVALRLIGLKILTSWLVPETYGELAVLLAVAALATHVLFHPLQQAALRYYADAARDGRVDGLRRLAIAGLARAAAGFTLAVAVGAAAWLGPLGHRGSVAAFAALAASTCVDAWRTFESNLLNAARRQREFAAWNLLDATLRSILPLALFPFFGPTATGVLIAYAVAGVLAALAFRGSFVRGERGGGASEVSRVWMEERRAQYRRFFLPIIPTAAMVWIIGAADRPWIAALAGLEAAGIYAAVYGLASQPFLAVNALGLVTFRPILFAAVSAGDMRRERNVLGVWLAAQAGVALAGWVSLTLVAVPLVHVAVGPAYWSGARLVPWIGAAYAIQGVQTVFETRLYAHRRTPRLLVIQTAGATTGLLLYALLIPRYGAFGAAIATLASMVVLCLASIGWALRSGSARAGES